MADKNAMSDDDDLPIITRVTAAAAGPSRAAPPKDDLEDDDELPDWAKAFQSPYKGGYKPPPLPSSSDDDFLDLTKDTQPTPGVGTSSQQPAPTATAPLQPAAPSQPDPSSSKPKPSGRGREKATGAPVATSSQQPTTANKRGGKKTSAAVHSGLEVEVQDINTQPQATQELMEIDDGEDGGFATQPPASSQLPGEALEKATPGRKRGAHPPLPPGAQLPIMLPEKLPRNKMLVELSAVGSNEEVLDLAGDAGAVGRMIVGGKAGHPEVSVDLKGMVFGATVLPLQGTALVINVQATEAKVEAIMNDFVRLTSQGTGAWGLDDDEGGGGGLAALLGDDEDDHYAVATQGDGEGGGNQPKGKGQGAKGKGSQGTAKKAAGKAGAGKGKGTGKKALGAQVGAVKKRKAAPKKSGAGGKGAGGKGKK